MALQLTDGLEPAPGLIATRPPAETAVDRAALSAIRLLFDRAHYLSVHPDVAASGIEPLDHFLTCGLAEGRSPCALFDPAFYLGQAGAPAGRDGLFLHYLTAGIALGLDPHPLVMSAHYREQAPALAPDTNPLTHMLGAGRREGRRPNPLFDLGFYARRLRGDTQAQHPLIHYARTGWRLRLQPHPLFDPDAYLEQRPDIEAAGIDPLAHYLRHGRREGVRPNWLFDAAHYAASCPEPVEPCDALLHLARHGSGPGRSPHPLFDAAHYLRQHPDPGAIGTDPFLHFLEFGLGENRDPHPLFDGWFYRSRNADVAGASMPAFRHYVRYGARENRDPNPCFPAAAYLARHPDAAAEPAGPLAHFLRTRDAHLEPLGNSFDPGYYVACHPCCRDAVEAGVPPLSHYLATGRARRLSPRPLPLDRHGWSVPAATAPDGSRAATPVLLVLHDAAHGDAALCALRAAEEMAADATLRCRVVIRHDGPLAAAFAVLAPTLVIGAAPAGRDDPTDRMAEILYSFQNEPDGVAVVTSAALGDVAALAGRLQLRLLAWLHELPVSIDSLPEGRAAMRALARNAFRIVAGSDAARAALLRHYALPPPLVTAIADGVAPPPPGLDARGAASALRDRLDLPPDALVVLGSGPVDFRSGADLFIRVAAAVVARVGRRITFVWTGAAEDRLFVGLCRHDIARLGLSGQVRMLEPQDELSEAQALLGADLFLQTAREPSSTLAVTAARNGGLPVIGFPPCGDAAAYAAGMLTEIPYLDVDAMAEAVLARDGRPARRGRPHVASAPSWGAWHLAFRALLLGKPDVEEATTPSDRPQGGGAAWGSGDPLGLAANAAAAAPTVD